MNNQLAMFNANEVTAYLAISPKTDEDAKIIFNSTNNPTYRLKDKINETIYLSNYYLEKVKLQDRNNPGEMVDGVRVILIDCNGDSYQCVSKGVMQALTRIETLFGSIDGWSEPKAVKVKLLNLGQNSMLSLELV